MTRASDVANILKQPFTNTLGTSNYRAGVNAGDSIASGGNYNVAIGDEAGTALTTGDDNIAIGFEALKTEDAHGKNIAIGFQALKTQDAGADAQNTAIGYKAGTAITTGIQNTLMGSNTAIALTDADFNTAIGQQALLQDTKGNKTTAIGHGALGTQNFTSSTDSHNTTVGFSAGASTTTGIQNTLIGSEAGDAFTDADFNVAIGYSALTSDTQGSKSTAVGRGALNQQNFSSATDAQNTAVGYQAGATISTGQNNTLVGSLTGDGITTGDRNTALGYRTLSGAVDDGQYNTCVGSDAGLVTTGDQNTFVGAYDPSTGGSGAEITSGSKNTILGSYNGNQDSLDIRTGSNNVVLSDGDGTVAAYRTGDSAARSWYLIGDADSNVGLFVRNISSTNPYGVAIQFPNEANNTTSQYFIVCSDSSASRFLVYANGNVVNTNNSYGQYSDQKLKENITDATSQWNDIKSLKVRKFNFKGDDLTQIGVVAQELESAGMNGLVEENADRDEDMKDLGTTTKSVKYSVLYMKAVKALQEAMTRIETLEAKVTALESK